MSLWHVDIRIFCVWLQVILKEREEKKRHQLIDDSLPLGLACDDQVTAGSRSSQMPERTCSMLNYCNVKFILLPIICQVIG